LTERARVAQAMASATRVVCNKEGNGNGSKSNGDKGGGQATATRAMGMEKANNNQPAMGLTKAGSGWQESVDKATTRPRQWATTNNESVWQMMMAVTKRARVERAMVMAMMVAVDEEGKGNDKKDGFGNKGGGKSNGYEGDGGATRTRVMATRVMATTKGDDGNDSCGSSGSGNGKGNGDSDGSGNNN
jgi:hypothetical protein